MLSRLRYSREILGVLPSYVYSGILSQQSRQGTIAATSLVIPFPTGLVNTGESIVKKRFHVQKFSAVSEAPEEVPYEVDILRFFEPILDELEGPCHYWLNKVENKEPFERDGLFLVLAGAFLGDSLKLGSEHVLMLERVKLLQRRYPQLHVFGFQAVSSIRSVASRIQLVHTLLEEYITFPVLLSDKIFPEMKNGAQYLLFKDFRAPVIYYDMSTDIGTIFKALEKLENESSVTAQNSKHTGHKQVDIVKEPYLHSFRNLLLRFPGCISVDEDGNRLFLSDSNNHRIIIFDDNGKILDCVGSSPGFEDGDFESSKLLRPAASFYHAEEDCLYFVDSENHAVRKADMSKRSLETIYPSCNMGNTFISIWNWILDKLGIERKVAPKTQEYGMESLIFPWHLLRSKENNLLIVNRNFHTLWVMNSNSGKIEDVVRGYSKIMEVCGQMIMEKISMFNQMFGDQLKVGAYPRSTEGHIDISLISSMATFHNDIIFCYTVGHTVLKGNRGSGVISNVQLSNFGILGLPYWVSCSFEKLFVRGDGHPLDLDHFQCVSVLPGRFNIQVNINIPVDTELAAPVQEGSIWRQVRGSAVNVSGLDDMDASIEKVGVAQQWFDDLDNLAFTPELEVSVGDENDNLEKKAEEIDRVQIASAVNVSPGTSEIIIYTVLYLKLIRSWSSSGNFQKESLERMLDIVDDKSERQERDAFIRLMLNSKRDIRELIFMKPLHLRVSLECQDHPKADKQNVVVLTESTVEVNVSLK